MTAGALGRAGDRLPERPGGQAPADLVAKREMYGAAATSRPPDLSATASIEVHCGVRCLRFAGGADCLVYAHGGGFRMGSPYTLHRYLASLAEAIGHDVLAVQYRLAPEHPFPAALNDCLDVWAALDHERARHHLAGDSAGGNLAAATFLAARRLGMPPPHSIVLLSPWLDLTIEASSFTDCAATDQRFSRAAAQDARRMYLAGHDPADELASPLFGDWRAAPPVLLQAGDGEVLRDDARALRDRLAGAGARVVLREYPGEPHVWHYDHPRTPGSRAAVGQVASFLGGLA